MGTHNYLMLGFFFTRLYCLVGCLRMIVWTHALVGVLCACVLYFCVCTCAAQLNMFHMERRSRNTIIIITISFLLSVLCGTCVAPCTGLHSCFCRIDDLI